MAIVPEGIVDNQYGISRGGAKMNQKKFGKYFKDPKIEPEIDEDYLARNPHIHEISFLWNLDGTRKVFATTVAVDAATSTGEWFSSEKAAKEAKLIKEKAALQESLKRSAQEAEDIKKEVKKVV